MLQICDWAVSSAHAGVALGNLRGDDYIPKSVRRRMPDFMRRAVGCALGVMTEDCELVFASRYGDLVTTVSLLESIADDELLSPSAFASSVHNAVPGMIDQIAGVRRSHTGVAAGPDSLAAGLIEAWLRLAANDAGQVVLVFADRLPPPPFNAQPDDGGEWFGAMRLRLSTDPAAAPAPTEATALVDLLASGCRSLALPTVH